VSAPNPAPGSLTCLLIGTGGREAALAWKLRQSPLLKHLHILPGNPGLARWGEVHPGVDIRNAEALAHWCRLNTTDVVLIGPEQPLVDGLADTLRAHGIPVFGPSQAAARLEGSKAWAKAFMQRHGIPTADYRAFRDEHAALDFLRSAPWPVVIKADGLAAGKGVILPSSRQEAILAVEGMLSGQDFGEAGLEIVIERRLVGPELSLLALCDGTRAHLLAPAQDHKRVGDGDVGPNTGGMGTFAPSPAATPELRELIVRTILEPTLLGMAAEGCPFTGTLFIGLMLCDDGPRVIEYNCRFGDPETQVVLPLLEEDLLELVWRIASGTGLENWHLPERWNGAAVCVVAAAGGYPGPVGKGQVIHGLDRVVDVECFPAGVALDGEGRLISAGGRVFSLMARADTLAQARYRVYCALADTAFDGMHYRRDIAARAASEEHAS
jgi:phosphoribosylamine--glycine ligase